MIEICSNKHIRVKQFEHAGQIVELLVQIVQNVSNSFNYLSTPKLFERNLFKMWKASKCLNKTANICHEEPIFLCSPNYLSKVCSNYLVLANSLDLSIADLAFLGFPGASYKLFAQIICREVRPIDDLAFQGHLTNYLLK